MTTSYYDHINNVVRLMTPPSNYENSKDCWDDPTRDRNPTASSNRPRSGAGLLAPDRSKVR